MQTWKRYHCSLNGSQRKTPHGKLHFPTKNALAVRRSLDFLCNCKSNCSLRFWWARLESNQRCFLCHGFTDRCNRQLCILTHMELLNTIDATPEHLKFSLFASTSKHKPHYVSTSAKRRTPLTNCRKLSDVLRSISMCGATRFAPAIC